MLVGLSEGVFLFAMGLGFFICYFSSKTDDKEIKSLGHVIGMLIIALATLFVMLNLIKMPIYHSEAKTMKCFGMMR